MPELPDITIYIEALEDRVLGHKLVSAKLLSPFLLRSVEPPLDAAYGYAVSGIERLGKRVAIGFENDIWLVFHLMVAGRFQWRVSAPAKANRRMLAEFVFEPGSLILTEAGTKKRASLHVVAGSSDLRAHDPGGLEPLECKPQEFRAVMRAENHTLKRALTDPRLMSGIGNAYSDEILHAAGLSPLALTSKLTDSELDVLYEAMRDTLAHWTESLRDENGRDFPSKVTAFRDGMAVHGRYGKPCPSCQTLVQRIRYASNETNYCPRCQTAGKLLADRALSRLLKKDWPRSIEELERRVRTRRE